MTSTGNDRERLTQSVTSLVAQGADLIGSMRAAWKSNPTAASDTKELERVHRTAVAQHTSAVRAYRGKVRRAKVSVVPMATTAAASGTVAVIAVATVGVAAAPVTVPLAAISGLAAYGAYKARRWAHNPPPEPNAVLPAPPPPLLRRGSRGDNDARRLLRIRTQIATMIPAITGMHPEAGLELALADAEAGAATNSLVERLAVLGDIERSLPGSEASRAAAVAAEQVAVRLAAAMLSAPDLSRGVDDVLAPAIDGLQAYAHGLTVSAETFGAGA